MVTRKRLAGFTLLTVVVCVLIWVSHWPQVKAAQWAVRSVVGAEIDLDLTGTIGKLEIEHFALYPDKIAQEFDQPLFTAKDISLSYQLWGNDGRFLQFLNVGEVNVYPNASDTESPNYQFLLDFLAQETDEEPDMAFVPQEIRIEELRVQGSWDTYQGAIDSIFLGINCVGPEDIEVIAKGSDLHLEAVHDDESVSISGKMEWTARYIGTQLETSYTLSFPDWIEGNGFFNVLFPDNAPMEWSWKSDQTTLYTGLNEAAVMMGENLPGEFDEITFIQARLNGTVSDNIVIGGGVDVLCRGFKIIQGQAVLFDNDIDVKARFIEGETLSSQLEFDFGEQRILLADFQGNGDAFKGKVEWADWSKDGVLDLTPTDFESTIRTLQFDTLGGKVDVVWDDTGYETVAHIHSKTSTGKESVFLDLDLKGNPNGGRWPEGHVDARLGNGMIQGAGFYRDDEDYGAELQLENVRVKTWAYVLVGLDLPDVFEGKVKGSVRAVMASEDDALHIEPALTLYELKYEDFHMQEAVVEGQVKVAPDRLSWSAPTLSLRDRGGEFSAELSNWAGNVDEGTYDGTYTVELDTSLIAEPMHWWDLYGTLSVSGKVKANTDRIELPIVVTSEDLGYGDWLLPYGSKITFESVLISNQETGIISSDDITIQVGDGTHFTMTEVEMNMESSEITAQYVGESDMSLAVEMGYVAAALGVVNVSGEIGFRDETLQATYNVLAEVETMSLPENAATVFGVSMQLDGMYNADSLDGKGELSIRQISAAGASMYDIVGGVQMAGTKMSIPDAHGILFDGTFKGSAEVGVLEETLPIWLNGSYEDIDLIKLTDEVQPPNTKLTGLASGTLSAEYSTEGLLGFVLNAESHEGFSMNRSMVEEIMQTQTLLGGIGAKKAEKAVAKFLGDAPQRPFDSAMLYVYLVEDVINGISELRSVKTRDYNGLNLTINLDIDKPALIQSLKLLEESNMNDVEF